MPGVDAARILRNARDLMNTNGRHWIKGDLRLEIDEEILEFRDKGRVTISPKAQVGDVAFCAWGGIEEVADSEELQLEAMEALVMIIDPSSYGYYKDEMHDFMLQYEDEKEYEDSLGQTYFHAAYPTVDHYLDSYFPVDERIDRLGDVIATWNDNDKRTWADVRDSLTKAAAKCKRK